MILSEKIDIWLNNNVEKLIEIVINQKKVFVLDNDSDEILFKVGNINFRKFIINRFNEFFRNCKLDMKADLETVMDDSIITYKTVIKYFPRINLVSTKERNDIRDVIEIKD